MDILWVNLKSSDEVDLDETYQISQIKAVQMFDDKFYILSNKY